MNFGLEVGSVQVGVEWDLRLRFWVDVWNSGTLNDFQRTLNDF